MRVLDCGRRFYSDNEAGKRQSRFAMELRVIFIGHTKDKCVPILSAFHHVVSHAADDCRLNRSSLPIACEGQFAVPISFTPKC